VRTQTTAEVVCEDTNNGEGKDAKHKKNFISQLSRVFLLSRRFDSDEKKNFYFLSPKMFLVFILMYKNFAAKFEKKTPMQSALHRRFLVISQTNVLQFVPSIRLRKI
jgi:hypothetical protein